MSGDFECGCTSKNCDTCSPVTRGHRGILDTWRSEAFKQGAHWAKCKAAETAWRILQGRPDARIVEAAIMRIEVPQDDEE